MSDRLLIFCPGERPAAEVASALAGLPNAPSPTRLDALDPFKALDGTTPALLVVDLETDPTLALALCRVARLRFPRSAIVGLVGENRLVAGLALREARIDAICPIDYDHATLAALFARQLEVAAERSAAVRQEPAPAPRTESPGDADSLRLFVRNLAHEVNNPLTTIRGLLQLLQHDGGRIAGNELRGALETMDGESRRISEIVTELEYFGGARKPVRTPVAPKNVVREALDSVGLQRVNVRERGTIGEVLIDREQFYLALRHLLGFLAAGLNGEAKRLDVAIATDPEQLTIDIVTPADARLRLASNPLVPLHGSRIVGTDRRSLACAFGIARAHGGNLSIEPVAEGSVRLRFAIPAPHAG